MGKKVEPRPVVPFAYCWGHAHTYWSFERKQWVKVERVIRDARGVVVEVIEAA